MARKVEVRASFQQDARYLSRLMEAVEKDAKLPINDKREVISKLKDVIIIFTKQVGREAA